MFDFLKKAFKSFAEKVSAPAEKKEEAEAKPKELKKLEEKEEQEKIKFKELEKLKEKEEQKSFLQTLTAVITETKISEDLFARLFIGLEIELIQNNVAFPIIQQIRANLEKNIVGKSFQRTDLTRKIKDVLKSTILDTLEAPKPLDILQISQEKKAKNESLVLMFVGVNGTGKTTQIAKLAHLLQKQNLRCVFAAADTFRAASIEQLEHHANKLNVRLIKHAYGADPAAVAFDAVKVKDKDVVLIDTAGRQAPNTNLMDEMAKIKRVAKPDLIIFVGEAIAGSDLVEQAKSFNEKISIDGIILTKADVDDKGGAMLSVVQATGKPILFIGTGQDYVDLEKFEPERFVEKII